MVRERLCMGSMPGSLSLTSLRCLGILRTHPGLNPKPLCISASPGQLGQNLDPRPITEHQLRLSGRSWVWKSYFLFVCVGAFMACGSSRAKDGIQATAATGTTAVPYATGVVMLDP